VILLCTIGRRVWLAGRERPAILTVALGISPGHDATATSARSIQKALADIACKQTIKVVAINSVVTRELLLLSLTCDNRYWLLPLGGTTCYVYPHSCQLQLLCSWLTSLKSNGFKLIELFDVNFLNLRKVTNCITNFKRHNPIIARV
jgi:hypothetical protein